MKQKQTGGRQTALTQGDIDEVGEDFWLTPPELMKALMDEFHFDFDACPFPRPAGLNNLKEDWGSVSWMNPPIGKGHSLSDWVNKAVEETKKGKTVVAILPLPRWFRKMLEVDAEFRFPGIVRFRNPKGRQAKSEGGGRIPDIIIVLRPKP